MAQLEHEGVDTMAYATSKRAFEAISLETSAESRVRIEQNYIQLEATGRWLSQSGVVTRTT